ncbi:MAG: Na/Pi cotransporter family protein [Eubacterium sp.]|nr:Na/Pi cotransporter family protein [Eubacterium sp.]
MTIFDLLTFVGGLALFLFGMKTMGIGLEKVSGGKLETVLEKMTNTRFKGLLLGTFVTGIIQSSSAVTVMAVGFVNSGIMQLGQVIGIIMGAHIGTTVTAWLLSLTNIDGSGSVILSLFKPSSFAPVLALIGIVLFMFFKSDKKKNVGSILLGFGVLLIGMQTMSGSVEGLKEIPEFTSILTKFQNPILGLIAGTVLTAIVQSSSASVGILQALSVTGSITVGSAFPIILGQNIGACVPVLLSSIGTNKNAKRAAGIYLIYSVFGAVLAMVLFYGIDYIISGIPFIDEQVNAVKIAIIHSVFNIFTTIVLFPFGKQLEKLMYIIVPSDKDEEQGTEVLENEGALVDERFLMSPSYALDKVKEQCDDMAALAKENIYLSLDFIKLFDRDKDARIKEIEKQLDNYEDRLETYLVKISTMDLSIYDSVRLNKLTHSIGNFERIGDYGYNILKTKRRMHKNNIHFSDTANKELDVMSKAVKEIVDLSTEAFMNDDVRLAKQVEPLEQVINNLKYELREKHEKRVEDGKCDFEQGMLFIDIVNSFERIADHCSSLAVSIIELSHGSFQTHSYLKEVKNSDNKSFMQTFEDYLEKYAIK